MAIFQVAAESPGFSKKVIAKVKAAMNVARSGFRPNRPRTVGVNGGVEHEGGSQLSRCGGGVRRVLVLVVVWFAVAAGRSLFGGLVCDAGKQAMYPATMGEIGSAGKKGHVMIEPAPAVR